MPQSNSDLNVFECTLTWAREQGLKTWCADTTGSTNTVAKDDDSAFAPRKLSPGEEFTGPTLYVTARQTHGRGRRTHTWTAPPGSSMFATWSFSIARLPQPVFSALVGLALYRAALQTWPELLWNLKAPNDLFLGTQKVAGILIETIDAGPFKRTVIGVGFNVMAAPPDIETATCLAAHAHALDESAWRAFLTSWLGELKSALLAGYETRLTPAAAAALTAALQRHPLLKEPLVRVDLEGQLHFPTRMVAWHEL